MSSCGDRPVFYRSWFAEIGSDDPAYGPSSTELNQLIEDAPEEAWSLIVGLVDHAADDEQLGWVAAGPLGDLLWYHGRQFVDRVAARAGSDSRFRKCLADVQGEGFDADVFARVQAAAAGSHA